MNVPENSTTIAWLQMQGEASLKETFTEKLGPPGKVICDLHSNKTGTLCLVSWFQLSQCNTQMWPSKLCNFLSLLLRMFGSIVMV
jgi:hypothetical protein